MGRFKRTSMRVVRMDGFEEVQPSATYLRNKQTNIIHVAASLPIFLEGFDDKYCFDGKATGLCQFGALKLRLGKISFDWIRNPVF